MEFFIRSKSLGELTSQEKAGKYALSVSVIVLGLIRLALV